jgi:uncharacterized protein YqeY
MDMSKHEGLAATLAEHLNQARREGDEVGKRTLIVLLAEVRNAAISAGNAERDLDDEGVQRVLARQAKQRRDAIEQFERGGRADLVDAEQAELALIEAYLPKQLDAEAIEAEVRAVIEELGVTQASEMGRVMGPLMGRLQGRADGKLVSATVRRLLVGG